jgi:hypothetical protein
MLYNSREIRKKSGNTSNIRARPITMFMLVPGYSYMSNDRVHGIPSDVVVQKTSDSSRTRFKLLPLSAKPKEDIRPARIGTVLESTVTTHLLYRESGVWSMEAV